MAVNNSSWALLLICILLCFWCSFGSNCQNNNQDNKDESKPDHWLKMAKRDLRAASQMYERVRNYRAKNAILYLGDGMGIPSVTAGRILKGQVKGKTGEETTLSFERFPHTGLAKTYNTDMQTPDSAGTATAFLCGVKAKSGTMGVDQLVTSRNCSSHSVSNNVLSFLREAQASGKSVGLVTTTRITHATPGAAYAHTAWRDWEDDTSRNRDVPNASERANCPDIAQQMIDNAVNFTVLFGGGRLKFLPKSKATRDPVTERSVNGSRSDSVNLVELWKQRQQSLGRQAKYLESSEDLENADINADAYLGLFALSHLSYELDNNQVQPSLENMTRKAIKILSTNPRGFVLLVEGGRIDHGHHGNHAKKALYEMLAFDKAIAAGSEMTNSSDTLSIVTADHSHVFSIGGWARRGQPIFGKVDFALNGKKNSKGETLALDGMPYTPLYYGDGPSAVINGPRINLTDTNTEDKSYRQEALVKFPSESHGAEDVPIYANGPGAHLIHTTHEQSYIAHVVKHSLCIGAYAAENYCLGIRRRRGG